MCQSLYVKANGDLPCWDDAGEELILRTLNPNRLQHGAEETIFYSPPLQHIRQSFALFRKDFVIAIKRIFYWLRITVSIRTRLRNNILKISRKYHSLTQNPVPKLRLRS
jgi:hypothetical protein